MHERRIILAVSISALFLVGLYFYSGSGGSTSDQNAVTTGLKNGERIAHRDDGSILSRVNYKDGLKHGDSYLYYDDGATIQLMMPYVNGRRQGTSIKYFQNGKIYAETSYDEDEIHGWRKLYYRTGQLKAEVPYGYGLPGVGLIEYYKSGVKKEMPAIQANRTGHILFLSITESCKDPLFYLGDLVMGSFFDKKDRELKMLSNSNRGFFIDLNVFTPSYLTMQDVICFCETSQGNPLVLKKRITL